MYSGDTICAIATGMAGSGIGIIRVSGDRAIEICDRIFVGRKKVSEMETFTAAYGHIVDPAVIEKNTSDEGFDGDNGHVSAESGINNRKMPDMKEAVIDEVVVLVMKAPHSYTTEDTVEIDCHGGVFLMEKVLGLLVREGARVAEPGEFTKRAYLNGRIDMSEAEAVMDVINAETESALSASVGQLRGDLREKIASLREEILYNTAYIESALDDPENYSLDGFNEKLAESVERIDGEVKRLAQSFDEGRIVREGIRTAIIGKPNAGKSSVLNMLLMEERAIVTDVAGTTRDTLEEYARLSGVLLKLIDTAGIRETEDKVEKIGVDKAQENIKAADLILFVADGARPLDDDDKRIIRSLAGKKVITLINKEDLPVAINRTELDALLKEVFCGETLDLTDGKTVSADAKRNTTEPHILTISAKEGQGRDELAALIKEMFLAGEAKGNSQIVISNERHKNALFDASQALGRVKESLENGLPEDFYTIDLMAAYESLGLITGETLADDLADKIFAEFCMGK